MSRRASSLPSVLLRRPEDGDASQMFKWRNHREVYSWCRQNDVLHWDKHRAWLESQASDPSVSMYVIQNDDGHAVGVCGLTSIDMVNRRAEFSLYIGPEHQGSGYGEAALRALVRKGFMDYGLNGIWGEAFDGNPAVKMFARVGFKEEGRRRQFYFREGKFIDAVLFSLMRSEHVG